MKLAITIKKPFHPKCLYELTGDVYTTTKTYLFELNNLPKEVVDAINEVENEGCVSSISFVKEEQPMIEESYVSFETARMLKEAGFEADCDFIMDDDGKRLYSPTQSLAARWLREKHRIALDVAFIPPSVDGDVWQYFVGEMYDMIWEGVYETGRQYATYAQAMEAGLQEAIKLIKK